jgi:Fe-S oxidoreductase
LRVREAVDAGAEVLATACPFCLLTLEDAVKTAGSEGKVQIMDIAELISQAI